MAADPRRPQLRAGFALITALVALIIAIALAAAIVGPNIAVNAERERVFRAAALLGGLGAAGAGILRFEADTKRLPRSLSQLSFPVSTADSDLCGKPYNNAAINEWTPGYTDRVHPTSGTPAGIGLAKDTLTYVSEGGVNYVVVLVGAVSENEALRLDAAIDTASTSAGSASGTVRWSSVDTDGTVTVYWYIPVSTGCAGGAVLPTPPTAAFTWVCLRLVCSFTDTSTDSDGTIASWSWTFGDATTSTLQHPTRTYAAAGTYNVSLTVTDDSGATGTTSQSVTARAITLSGVAGRQGGNRWVDLTWSGAIGTNVDVYRNNVLVVTTPNDGSHRDVTGNGTFTFRICEEGTNTCSTNITVST